MASLPTGPFLNAQAIYKGLLAMGLTANAAAGVAGNIYQESHGNPSSGSGAGGGLFGETLANGGSVSGGSLTEQLSALDKYIKVNGSIADINAHASTPTAAAVYFSDRYERPGIPAISNRTAAANWVAGAASSGNWGAGVNVTPDTGGGGGGGILSIPTDITNFFSEADKFVTLLMWLAQPSSWLRIGAFVVGVGLLLFAVHALIAVGEGGAMMPKMPNIVPVPI
jgi:hypothetical protein